MWLISEAAISHRYRHFVSHASVLATRPDCARATETPRARHSKGRYQSWRMTPRPIPPGRRNLREPTAKGSRHAMCLKCWELHLGKRKDRGSLESARGLSLLFRAKVASRVSFLRCAAAGDGRQKRKYSWVAAAVRVGSVQCQCVVCQLAVSSVCRVQFVRPVLSSQPPDSAC